MTKFISDGLTKFLSTHNAESAITINSVSSDSVDSWIETLTPHQRRWVKDNKFNADKDEIIKIVGDFGELSSIAIGTGSSSNPTDLNCIALLGKRLPDGHYKLAADFFDQSTTSDSSKLYLASKLASVGWALAQYNFDHYQQKKNQCNAILVVNDTELLEEASAIVNGITLIRNLVNTPTCDMGPSHLSAVMQDLANTFNASFNTIVGDDLLTKGFNTIHAVGRAATNEPRLLDLQWGREDAPKVTLVGKGVCFDTGGLDIKSTAGMRLMKKDMGGAAHTLGIAQMIMTSGLDIRLRLLIPAVENNISADAFRPGDIIKTYKGTTVEVDNTDAEGRLVLCDALALASEEDPDLLIDFATLTGAARVAMGTDIVPFFTDSDSLATDLFATAEVEKDPLWRMPLYRQYEGQLKSSCADLRNCGPNPFGGAIIAALFLKHFVVEPQKWIHFDLYAWNLTTNDTCPEGGEAMAIRAIFTYLKSRFGH